MGFSFIMKFAICNEIFGTMKFRDVCKLVSEIGYKGIEIAPFTFGENVKNISKEERQSIKNDAQDFGLQIVAMHWLLKTPEWLSISTPDRRIYRESQIYFESLIEFARDLNVPALVFGSPKQRNIELNWYKNEAITRAKALLKAAGEYAQKIEPKITIAIEPLSPSVTNFGDSVDSVIQIIKDINQPNVKIHLDAIQLAGESESPDVVIDKVILALGKEYIAHVHLNETNFLGPGMMTEDKKLKARLNLYHTMICDQIIKKLKYIGYKGWYSVETFDTKVTANYIAVKSFNFMKKVWLS
jgi:sugar phosphate isomerase/epimerase